MHPARLPSSFCLCRLAEDRAFLLQAIPEHPAEGELDWELIARHFGRCVLDWERRWCLRGRCVLDWEPIALHFGRCVLRQLFPGFGRCVLGCNHCPPLERRGTRLASATGRGSGLSQLSRDGKCRHNAHVAKLLLMRLQLWGAAAPPPCWLRLHRHMRPVACPGPQVQPRRCSGAAAVLQRGASRCSLDDAWHNLHAPCLMRCWLRQCRQPCLAPPRTCVFIYTCFCPLLPSGAADEGSAA